MRHPSRARGPVEAFLTHLAVAGRVSSSTQSQAKSALLFLYKELLGSELPWLDGIQSAKVATRLPVVLTADEVVRLLDRLRGTHALVGRLLYGTGMRILEALRLRVKDVDFARGEILVRDGKGAKDRVTMLPGGLSRSLREQMTHAARLHRGDAAAGFGHVFLPAALASRGGQSARPPVTGGTFRPGRGRRLAGTRVAVAGVAGPAVARPAAGGAAVAGPAAATAAAVGLAAAFATPSRSRASHSASSASARLDGTRVPDWRMPQRKRENGGRARSSKVTGGTSRSTSSRNRR